MSHAIVHSRLDTDALPDEERFALFRGGLGATHDAYRRDGDDRPFRARLDAWLVDDMVITAGCQMASRMVRTAERAKADGIDYLTFMLVREGAVSGEANGPISFSGGQIAIFDLTRPIDVHTSDNRNIGVRLSRSQLERALRPLPDLHGTVLTGTAAQLIGDHFIALVEHAANMPAGDAPLIARATAAIVASCLLNVGGQRSATVPASGRQAAIRDRAILHIDAHLTSPDVDSQMLCLALNLSRSNLYRAFQESGGVAAFIRERRLQAAHKLLCDPEERRNISELAFVFGFANAAHFSAVFKRRFGYPPRSARVLHTEAARCADNTQRRGVDNAYKAWLNGIRTYGMA